MPVPHIHTYLNLEPERLSRERRKKEQDLRAKLNAELELLRGPKVSLGSVQRWNYNSGGRHTRTWD